jgi:hypothetical protein
MRIVTSEELKLLRPERISENEILKLPPVWCVICKKFIKWTLWCSFIGSIDVGGTYCGWHSKAEIENFKQANAIPDEVRQYFSKKERHRRRYLRMMEKGRKR